jgi:hypothetical protein
MLTGHVAEWGELLNVLQHRRGLTVVCADPWSGSSPLLAGALAESGGAHVLADARRCTDALDLAMTIADSAVASLTPDAYGWWVGDAPPNSAAGLRVWRSLSLQGVDLDGIRLGEGRGPDRLLEAVELVAALADGPGTLAIDHLGVMLANTRGAAGREILSLLRTGRQRHPELDLILVDQPTGVVSDALGDSRHPLYHAGERLRITRPTPDRFISDLMITRPMVQEPVPMLRAAAEIAAGVPALIWRIVDHAPAEGEHTARAVAGWQALRDATAPSVRQEWDLLRRVHPAAMSLVSAISLGLPPHSIPAASKSVDDGLNRLRDVRLAWQPEPRRWAIADPLLAAYARQYAPAWATRRSAYGRS